MAVCKDRKEESIPQNCARRSSSGRRDEPMKTPQISIADDFWTDTTDKILSLLVFGGFLALLLWLFATQFRPFPTLGSTIFYYGTVLTVSLILLVVIWRNSLFHRFDVERHRIVEVTSFWKMVRWQRAYPRQDVAGIAIDSWQSGFPAARPWYAVCLRLGNGKRRIMIASRDRRRIEVLAEKVNAIWSKE
jgi:hypothetical protein